MTDDHNAARDEFHVLYDAFGTYRPGHTERVIEVLNNLHAAGWQITRRDPAAGRVSEPRTHDPDDVPYCRHGFPEGVGCDACRRELTEATTG